MKIFNKSGEVAVYGEGFIMTGETVTLFVQNFYKVTVSAAKRSAQSRLGKGDSVEIVDAYYIENAVGTKITVLKIKTCNGIFDVPLHSDVMIEGLIFSGEKSDYSSSPNEEEDDED